MQSLQIFFKYKAVNLVVMVLFFGTAIHAQSNEARWLHDINPSQTHSQFWVNTSKSVYPLAVATPAAVLAAGFIKKDKALQQKGWQLCAAVVVNTAITQGLKYSINRNRPYQDYPTYIVPYQYDNDPSFPSGHTSTAFATATALSMAYKKWYVVVPSFTWAAAVGYSRLHLGEHYPTDVLAGAAIGVGSAYVSHWLTKKLFKK